MLIRETNDPLKIYTPYDATTQGTSWLYESKDIFKRDFKYHVKARLTYTLGGQKQEMHTTDKREVTVK